MKITRTKLKQIIKEELESITKEAKLVGDGTRPPRDFCVGYVEKEGGKRGILILEQASEHEGEALGEKEENYDEHPC